MRLPLAHRFARWFAPCRAHRFADGRGPARLAAGLALFVSLLPPPALAWNATGHRLVAAIAWDALDVRQQQAIGELLLAHPAHARWQAAAGSAAPRALFVEAATWPDRVRWQSQLRPPRSRAAEDAALGPRRHWHYVNRPLADPDGAPRGGALHRALPALAGWLADPARPARERADALVWLSHLVADAHQPLHVVSRALPGAPGAHDAGGNRLAVRLPGKPRSTTNLHRLWDDFGGSGRLRGARLDHRARQLAARATASAGPGEALGAGGAAAAIAAWLAESHALARRGVYPDGAAADARREAEITADYLAWAQSHSDLQLARAGRRLALLLQHALAAAEDDPPR